MVCGWSGGVIIANANAYEAEYPDVFKWRWNAYKETVYNAIIYFVWHIEVEQSKKLL